MSYSGTCVILCTDKTFWIFILSVKIYTYNFIRTCKVCNWYVFLLYHNCVLYYKHTACQTGILNEIINIIRIYYNTIHLISFDSHTLSASIFGLFINSSRQKRNASSKDKPIPYNLKLMSYILFL